MRAILITLILVIILCSCAVETAPDKTVTDGDADWHASKVNIDIVEANTEFALDILKELSEEDEENIFFSPISLSIALSMTLNGAAGNTLAEMLDVLHYSDITVAELNEQNQHLIESLSGCDPDIELGLANSVWIKENFPVKDEFIEVNEEYYRSQIFPEMAFDEETVELINDWSEQKTNV